MKENRKELVWLWVKYIKKYKINKEYSVIKSTVGSWKEELPKLHKKRQKKRMN